MVKNWHLFPPCLLLGLILSGATIAHADQCQLLGITPVNFGPYNPDIAQNTGVGSIVVSCLPGTHITIALINSAKMTGSSRGSLSYTLCLDSGCQTIWGDGTRGSATYQNTFGPGVSRLAIPVYAKITGNQAGAAGNYLDNVTVSISY